MRSRRFLHAAGIAALAAMLFTQAAFALAACSRGQAQSRAQVILAQNSDPAPCHEPADNANLCLAHCQSGEQTLDKHHVNVPDASLQAVLTVRVSHASLQPVIGWAPRAPSPAAGPPPRILFRTLLI